VFDQKLGKSLSARVFFYWPTADVAVGMPHALGKTPTGWRVVSLSRDGAPGQVYAPVSYTTAGTSTKTDQVYNFSRNYVVLACTTANTWAEVEVFA
jgi:hypothetical protein